MRVFFPRSIFHWHYPMLVLSFLYLAIEGLYLCISIVTNKWQLSSEFHSCQALDFVISEAIKYKVRLIQSLCNNWNDYGGKPQYVRWGKEAGLDLTSDDDFFSDPTIKSYYKAFVKVNIQLS